MKSERVKTSKKIIKAVLCIAAIFIAINVCWYVWRTKKYSSYSMDMEKNYFSTWIVPRYIYTDTDGFDYAVKYPDYLSFTGNLSVGLPAMDDNPFTDFLIIWPKVSGDYEYGVSITENGQNYQIYVSEDGSAVYPEDSEVVARNQETISTLIRKSKEMWNLE